MKIKISLLIIMLVSFSTLQAQDQSKEYKSIMKFSAVNFFFKNFQLGIERSVSPNQSVYFTAGYTYEEEYSSKKEGLNLEFQYKYIALEAQGQHALKRIYFAPYLGYKDFDLDQEIYNYDSEPQSTIEVFDIKAVNAGVLIGITFILKERFVFDFYVGGGIRKTNDYDPDKHTYQNGIMDVGYNGIAPRIGFDVGITF